MRDGTSSAEFLILKEVTIKFQIYYTKSAMQRIRAYGFAEANGQRNSANHKF